MTAKYWRIGLVVALLAVVSRPSATVRTGSPDSGWWGSKEAKQTIESARKEIQGGHYAAAEGVFAQAAAAAKRRGDRIATARLLSGVGGARLARFDYTGALKAYVEAQKIAQQAGDWFDLGAIDLNLSNVYEQVWDLGAALRAAEEGRLAAEKTNGAYYTTELLMQMGRLHDERGDQDPSPLYEKAIEAARELESKVPEAEAWSLLGKNRLSHGDIDGAEDAFLRSFYIRQLFMGAHRFVGRSYTDFGALELARAEVTRDRPVRSKLLERAARFTSRAQEEASHGAISSIPFELTQQRGRILLLRGDVPGALEELSAAVESAEQWRGGMATAELQEQVFATFIEAAASYGLKTRDSKWIRASFLAEETLRASNLRDNAGLIELWRRRLPEEFWGTIAQLRAAQARLRNAGASESAEVDSLQLKLIGIEAEAGLGLISKNRPDKNKPENFVGPGALIHYRSVLSDSAVLLSFKLGDAESFVWALTRGSLNVYRLAGRERVAKLVRHFRSAIQEERPDREGLAKELYAMLFSQLKPEEAGKRDWLISPADALLQLPFAALATDQSRYLAEAHSIQIVEGMPRRAAV
ncbi:MAG: hypothetical protein JO307_28050, partial [Bryobacterales bacterium]|nr:hypothetical protein [Bryobacterales bacterium]